MTQRAETLLRTACFSLVQAFLEGHELGFAYFDGVFRTLRYDNLTIAVKKILRGYRREETSRVAGCSG